MAILTTGNTFVDGNQVTATKLNLAVTGALFVDGQATDGTTTYVNGTAISVKDGGITAAKLATGVNGALFIGNGTGFDNRVLDAGTGIAITNTSGHISISAASLGTLTGTNDYMVSLDHSDTTGKTFKKSTAFFALGTGDFEIPLDKAFWCGYIDAAIQVKTPAYYSGADKVVGARGAAVPDVTSTTNISGSDMVNETTVLASIQALETKLNLLLSRLRSTGGGHGLIT